MTSRPGPGIHESLQHRGGGPPRPQVRRQPSKPSTHTHNAPPQDSGDPTHDVERRASEDAAGKTRSFGNAKGKLRLPDATIQTENTDQGRPVPAGKPQLLFCNAINYGSDTTALQSPQIQASNAPPTLPMPPRPGSSFPADLALAAPRIVPGNRPRQDAAPRPGLDTPPVTFPGGKTADLFPWNGNHPEDTLSEALVKSGISNKPTIMNETQTARPSLYPLLKKNNNKGASMLSSYFMSVLEKRQSCGRLTTPNTFKPPPRLTLRDSTREAWLHDLANPTVGLRRLSRTIPHGITGKVLLDQCLNKNIPIPRAIWLAKCVGLNEMRSHKRKGQAGTITWVRGWTSSVEQFLEAIIAAIGREEWKPRITYALRLVTNLYREYLLEGEHFLDWILKSLDTSSSERLFIWLLVASVYWKDLIETRRRGRRLAESLLCQAEKLSQLDDGDNNSPIQGFMNNVLANLIISSPSSLLLPKVWDKYKGLLHRVAEARPDRDMARRLADLNRRNRRLMSRTSKLSPETDSSSQTFLSLLDSVDYRSTIHIEALCSQCMELLSDTQILISKALHWASSIYREGAHRVYLVIRLLRRWNRLGFDTDSGILSFLRSMGTRKDIDIRNISKIVAELVRSKTFSVGKYLQWLIATGSLNANQDLMEPTAWPVRLLTEIPLSGLPVEIRNLRNTLLQGSGFSAAAEERMFNLTQESIKQHIPNLFDMATLVDHPPEINTANLSSTIRLELSVWLRQQVAENVEMVEQVSSKHTSSEEDTPVSTISVSDFYAIRSYIEDVGDISILADIVGIVSTSMDYAVLAALADTLHYHYKSLSAIGALKPLFQKVISRYTSLRNLRFPDREYVLSLLDLARTAKADSQLVQLLQDDLIRCDQRSAIAACSPVSDNMGEAAHTGLEGDDEIDRILSSGTSMDQQIMSRVFSKISSRLERQVSKGSTSPDSCASWFHRLRSFEDKAFDKLVSEWISSLLMNLQGKVMLAALPPLVTSGCFTFSQFVELSRRSIESRKASSDDGVVRMCVEALNALLPSDNLNRLCPSYDAYRYRLQQRKFCQESNGEVLAFIREAIGTCASQSSGIDAQISGLIASNRLRSIIRYFAIYDRKSLDEVFGIESSSAEAVSSCMKSLLDGLLDPSGSLCLADSTIENQVTNVVNAADELSLPFCQLELRHIFSVNPPQSEAYNAASNALLDSIKTAVEEDQPSWSELVAGLDNDLNTKIREHAEREILNGSAFLTSSKDTTSRTTESDDKAFIQRYLTVINSTASDTRPDGQSQTFTTLVERLRSTVEALGKTTDPASVQSSVATVTLPGERFCIWLNALLELSVIQIALPIAKTPNQTQAAFLWCLRSLFTHSSLQAFPSMMEFAFDIATVFSDIISEEVRNHLMKLDNAKTLDDARCAFIFGSGPPLDGWLGLVKSPTTSMVPQATPSQSQSPSAMPPQNQQPYQNPQFNSPSPVPLHRSLSQQQQQQAQARMYPQYNQQPQHSQHKQMLPQFPRMNSAPQQNPQMQPTPTQQMQMNFAQQRAGAPSPIAGQRQLPSQPSTPQSVSQPAGTAAKAGLQRQDKPEVRPIPFSLRRWEIIPESGGNGSGNETALSLSLFGARKV